MTDLSDMIRDLDFKDIKEIIKADSKECLKKWFGLKIDRGLPSRSYYEDIFYIDQNYLINRIINKYIDYNKILKLDEKIDSFDIDNMFDLEEYETLSIIEEYIEAKIDIIYLEFDEKSEKIFSKERLRFKTDISIYELYNYSKSGERLLFELSEEGILVRVS